MGTIFPLMKCQNVSLFKREAGFGIASCLVLIASTKASYYSFLNFLKLNYREMIFKKKERRNRSKDTK